jgi:hypothetical protein
MKYLKIGTHIFNQQETEVLDYINLVLHCELHRLQW